MKYASVHQRAGSPRWRISYFCTSRQKRVHATTPFLLTDPQGRRKALTFAAEKSKFALADRSAAGAGCVDFVLAPEAIAKELARIARHPYVAGPYLAALRPVNHASAAPAGLPDRLEKNGYQTILQLLRNHSGVDFSLYKTTTIHRRITRRTVLNGPVPG